MVKPLARPLIRCVPVCLAAAAFILGGAALPGVAVPGIALAARGAAFTSPATLPGVPSIPVAVPGIAGLGVPLLEGLPQPGLALPTPLWRHLDPLRPVQVLSPAAEPAPGAGGAAQPGDPDGWLDRPDPAEPDGDEEPPDEPAPDEEEPDGEAPAAPVPPVPPADPVRPTVGPLPPTDSAPRPAPVSPAPRHPRTPRPTPSPADTRGLDELFPDRPSSDTPAAGAPHASTADPEPVGYARPLIYSGIAGMLVSAIGIGVVLNRRRGW